MYLRYNPKIIMLLCQIRVRINTIFAFINVTLEKFLQNFSFKLM